MGTLSGFDTVVPLFVTFPRGAEWIVILIVILLLFGARKLPELANSVGRSIKEFRKGAEDAFNDDTEAESEPTPDRDAER